MRTDQNANILKLFRGRYIVLPDKVIEEKVDIVKPEVKESKGETYTISAYTLNFESTQKSRGNPDYGKTSSGFNLKGHTLASARVIATDPNYIPTGSKVKIVFNDDKYKKYNAIYTAKDVGGGIIGLHIDLFVGDSPDAVKRAVIFGKTQATVTIINEWHIMNYK